MSSELPSIRRCQHVKINGTQCGSPAMREHSYCYFHTRWHRKGMPVKPTPEERQELRLPTLEDANSIQAELANVMRELCESTMDHKTAGLILYALQIASANVKHTSFEPSPTEMIIDSTSLEHCPNAAANWSNTQESAYNPLDDDRIANPEAWEAATKERARRIEESEQRVRSFTRREHP